MNRITELNRREASKFLGVKYATMAKWASKGTGPTYRLTSGGRGTAFYSLEDLEAYKHANQRRMN